ncbi:MAG: DNA polymerase III subunit delta [Magnetococcales bacterium]|nr:DNA polymerase III subunit delta [Magnetococcales bacterium]
MKLTPRDFPQRLRQEGPPSVLLIYGQEQGLAARQALQVRRAVVSVADEEMDAESHHGADLDVGRFLSGCNAFPFFAKKRFVLLKEADQLAAPARDALLKYLKSPSKSSVLVVLAGPLEAKNLLRKTFEADKTAWCLPCYPLEGRELVNWLRSSLKEAGFAVDDDAVSMLAERLEGDARNAESELEKLIVFLGERRRVTLEDVLESIGGSGTQNGFTLAAAVMGGRTGPALTILDGLLEGGEEPLMLLGLLVQRLRRVIQGAALLDKGEDQERIAMILQVFWKEKNEFFTQARSLGVRRLANGLLRCQEADRELKSGGEPRRVMERLVMGLARTMSAERSSSSSSASFNPRVTWS